jgi:hypothetical protein
MQDYEREKTGFVLDMMALLGYDAVTVGEREFNYGYRYLVELTRKSKVPVVCANLRDKASGKLVWEPYVIVRKQGLKVAVAGLFSHTLQLKTGGDSVVVDDARATAEKLVPELRQKADVVVLLSHLGRTESLDLAGVVPGIDVLVVGHQPSLILTSRKVNQTVAVHGGTQGQNIGETLLFLEGKKVADATGKVVILLPEVGERADIAKLAKDFEDAQNERLKKKQQEEALSQVKHTGAGDHYLGMSACISCHQPQYEQWKSTAHAHAFATLEKESKEATPECVQCHVTGWNLSGGYRNQATTAGLKDVQCETCHGMGTLHNMFDATAAAPPESLCVTCHTPENDPSWNYAAKLPKVVH